MSSSEPTAVIIELPAGDIADSLVLHTPSGSAHAVRPAAPVYLIALPEAFLNDAAVALARQLVGYTDEHGRWVVPAAAAPPLLAAVEAALAGEPRALTELTLQAVTTPATPPTPGNPAGTGN